MLKYCFINTADYFYPVWGSFVDFLQSKVEKLKGWLAIEPATLDLSF